MATVPVTPKKEGKEIYFSQQKNCWQKKFSVFLRFSTPDMLFCGKNLFNLCK